MILERCFSTTAPVRRSGSVQAEGGLAQAHAGNDPALVGPHATHDGPHLIIQLHVAELRQILVHRKAVPALEDEGYFECA